MPNPDGTPTPIQDGGKDLDKKPASDVVTPATEDGKPTGDEDKKTPSSDDKSRFIPRDRFDEVYTAKKAAEDKLAQIEANEKKKADEDALKRGEHEKIISERDVTIADLNQKLSDADVVKQKLVDIAKSQLDSFGVTYGEDMLAKAKVLIGSEDPLVIMEKLPAFEDIVKKDKIPSGGSDLPGGSGGDKTRLQTLQDRLSKGEVLSSRERDEYFKLVG